MNLLKKEKGETRKRRAARGRKCASGEFFFLENESGKGLKNKVWYDRLSQEEC